MKNKLKLISLTISTLLLIGCASRSDESFVTKHNTYTLSNELSLTERQRADLYEAIITAEIAEHEKDYLTAMSYYLFASELSNNMQLILKSVETSKAAKDYLGLQQAAKIWLSVSPNDLRALKELLEAQIERSDIIAALETITKILSLEPDHNAQFELLQEIVLDKEPRIVNYILKELEKLTTAEQKQTQIIIITAQAKFYFKMATQGNQSANLLLQAMKRVEDALHMDPLFSPAIRVKAHILFQSQEYDKARVYLKNLFKKNPESADISHMYGELLYDTRDFKASLNHYDKWLKKHAKDLKARNYLAASHYALGQYEESLSHFKTLVENRYQYDVSAFYCGDSAQKLKQPAQAKKCFEMVKAGRFLALAKVQLANLLAEEKDFEQSLAVLRTPYFVKEKGLIQLKIAEINLLDEHFSNKEAKQVLEEALVKFPNNISLLLKKIDLFKLLEAPDKLITLLNQAKNGFEPGKKLDRFNLAAAALLKNNEHYQLAIDWLNQALVAKENDKELLYTRALYKEPLGLYDEMVEEFKHLLSLYPDDLNIKNALGYTLADLGRELDYAQALIDSAYQGLPNSAAVIDSKGWISYRLGNLNAAKEYLIRAFGLSPSAEGAAHLGEVLWQQSKTEAAKAIFLQGIEIDPKNKVLQETLKRLNIQL